MSEQPNKLAHVSRRRVLQSAGALSSAAVLGRARRLGGAQDDEAERIAAVEQFFDPSLITPHLFDIYARDYFRRGWRRNGSGVLYFDIEGLVASRGVPEHEAEIFGSPITLYMGSILETPEIEPVGMAMRVAPPAALSLSPRPSSPPGTLTTLAAQGFLTWIDSRSLKVAVFGTEADAAEAAGRAQEVGPPTSDFTTFDSGAIVGDLTDISSGYQGTETVEAFDFQVATLSYSFGQYFVMEETRAPAEFAGDIDPLDQLATDTSAWIEILTQFSTPESAAQSSLLVNRSVEEIEAMGGIITPAGFVSPDGLRSPVVAQWPKFRTVDNLVFDTLPEEDERQRELNEEAECVWKEEGSVPNTDLTYRCEGRFYAPEEWAALFLAGELPVQQEIADSSGTETEDDPTFEITDGAGRYVRVAPDDGSGRSFAGYQVTWVDVLGPVQYLVLDTNLDSGGDAIDPDSDAYRRLRDGMEALYGDGPEEGDDSAPSLSESDPTEPTIVPQELML